MKKWFLIVIIFISGLIIYSKSITKPNQNFEINLNSSSQLVELENYKRSTAVNVDQGQVYQGDLLLVNNEHQLQQEGIKKDIVNLSEREDLWDGFALQNTEIYLSDEVATEFTKMIASANESGVGNFIVNSGYRGLEEQNQLYVAMGADYALPAGKSEHNLGLSLDVGSLLEKMAVAPEGKWIEENAWEYGFVLRYPEDKVEITGIQYEPWHIRYVGLPHSVIMHENNFVLEEYLDYLKQNDRIYCSYNGVEYLVVYYRFTPGMEIEIPDLLQYEISGNNVDGIIVTMYK